ncbi:MAG TPA: peptide chain release factor 3 [Pantanalinema sp.]
MSLSLSDEVRRRRTFAIISHPDAGKTTLTEKLLLYGGAIHMAGSVKARRAQRHATSDWMELERQRGISITSSVMQFPYEGLEVNLLDTPGHEDFSEDTYRTLTAVDSAVMLIDAAKGVEAQTKKLFQVCRLREIPIFTFINKLDRFGRDPLDLMDELEKVLGIRSCPMNWPIGMGSDFKGVFVRATRKIHLFKATDHGQRQGTSDVIALDDPALPEILGAALHAQLLEDIEMLEIAGDPFDLERVLAGQLSPLFFGSAMTNFGVQIFLDDFVKIAPSPVPRETSDGPVAPDLERFSGFIFKIQANMNPAHRDCMAFMRVCSGKFTRGMTVKHARTNRDMRLANSHQLLAQDRAVVEEAYPGDIVALFDSGNFRIGDTLCEGKAFEYRGIPRFMPEHFAQVRLKDPSKRKQLKKGLDQLAGEGAVQVFYRPQVGDQEAILGAVGVLQFEVMQHRLKAEYGVDIILDRMGVELARWVTNPDFDYRTIKDAVCVVDRDEQPVLLFRDQWMMRFVQERNPNLVLTEIS